MTNELSGRITLADPFNIFSKLGIFKIFNGEKYLNLEEICTPYTKVNTYLIANQENESFINKKVSVGDIVKVYGNYSLIEDKPYFLAEKAEIISKCESGKKSLIFSLSKEVINSVKLKANILKNIREYFELNKFTEIISPILFPFYEGGDASPFQTQDKEGHILFLKETNELILRRLISCGLGPIYEIGKSFRNIGTNQNSLQEFSVIESAIPYHDLFRGIDFSEGLLKHFLKEFKSINPSLIDSWERVDFNSVYKKLTSKEYLPKKDYLIDRKEFLAVLNELNGQKPIFLIGLPHEISPINKRNETTLNEAVLVINGDVYCDICEFETSKKTLEERLIIQKKRTNRTNSSFLDFSSYGLVPGVGIAFGIERWMKYLSGLDISKLSKLGGII